MDSQKTGMLIAERRCKLGLTQKQLAEQLHLSDRTISRWERGVGFPDISLLEPLADALSLSVLELLQGERLDVPHKQVEDTVRDAARTFGAKFKTSFRRLRWALITLAAIAVLLMFGYLLLHLLGWLNPFYMSTEEISATDAVDICPFLLITTEEYSVIHQLLQEEVIRSQFDKNEIYVADDTFLQRYEGMFRIAGESAEITEISIIPFRLYVSYRVGNRLCILSASLSGESISKTCAQYEDSADFYILENQDNQAFSILKEDSKLSLILSK